MDKPPDFPSSLRFFHLESLFNAGVPRDDIFSPILFKMYASDQSSTLNTLIADYDDDKVILLILAEPVIATTDLLNSP